MVDVELVIKIPEEMYKQIIDENGIDTRLIPYKDIIKNGIQLLKGHGRLIDEKEATNLIAEGKNGNKAYFGTLKIDWEVIDFLKTVSTIIEANKEEDK